MLATDSAALVMCRERGVLAVVGGSLVAAGGSGAAAAGAENTTAAVSPSAAAGHLHVWSWSWPRGSGRGGGRREQQAGRRVQRAGAAAVESSTATFLVAGRRMHGLEHGARGWLPANRGGVQCCSHRHSGHECSARRSHGHRSAALSIPGSARWGPDLSRSLRSGARSGVGSSLALEPSAFRLPTLCGVLRRRHPHAARV